MIRFRLMLDKDKETQWLDQMADEGFALKSFFAGLYIFETCEKGEWQYQIDIGKGFFSVNREYAQFMEEMGVEIVQAWGPWVILRRHRAEGEFQLYSDVDSRIEHYKKILLMFKMVTVIEFLCLLLEVYGATRDASIWTLVFIIAAVLCCFMNMTVRTKRVLNKLYEQKGEMPPANMGRRVSPLVPAGFLINAVNLLLQERIPIVLRWVMLIAALLLIGGGVINTAASKE